MLAAGRQAGTTYQLQAFDPASQQVLTIHMQVAGDELVTLPESTELLSHQHQIFGLSHGNQSYDLWLDEQGFARKGSMNLVGQSTRDAGLRARLVRWPPTRTSTCSARADGRSARTAAHLQPAHGYRCTTAYDLDDNRDDSPFINTDEQHVIPLSKGHWHNRRHVRRAPRGQSLLRSRKTSAPNAWLQSECAGNPQARGEGRRFDARQSQQDAAPAQFRQRLHYRTRS